MSGPKHTPTVLSGPCPSCGGLGYHLSVPGDYGTESFDCPDCAGTGKAGNSITANEKLRDAAPRLAEALQRLLNSRHPYAPELHHTEAFRKYVVAESFAREALREAGMTDDA